MARFVLVVLASALLLETAQALWASGTWQPQTTSEGDAGGAKKPVHRPPKKSESLLAEPPNLVAEVTGRLGAIDKVVLAVDEVVQLVNATTQDALHTALDTSRGLSRALAESKAANGMLDTILGEDPMTLSRKLLDRVSTALGMLSDHIDQSQGRVDVVLSDSVREFRDIGYESRRMYVDAALQVRRAISPPPKTSLLQVSVAEEEVRARRQAAAARMNATAHMNATAEGIFDWFFPPTECDKAHSAVYKADGSVNHLKRMLVALNASLCKNILEASVNSVQGSMQTVRTEMDGGVQQVHDKVPQKLIASLSESLETTCSMITEDMEVKVAAAEMAVISKIDRAMSSASELHNATDILQMTLRHGCEGKH